MWKTAKTKNMRNLVGTQLELSPLLGSVHNAGRYCAGYQSHPSGEHCKLQ